MVQEILGARGVPAMKRSMSHIVDVDGDPVPMAVLRRIRRRAKRESKKNLK